VDQRHNVYSIDENLLSNWSAQGHMQNLSLLGDVDLFPAKHGVDARPQSGLLGKLQQELNRPGL